jgi:sec-independent protein translocase protein TatA
MFHNPSTDLLVVVVILLLFFAPKRLPGLGKSLGSGIKEFKDGIGRGSAPAQQDPQEIPPQQGSGDSGSAS